MWRKAYIRLMFLVIMAVAGLVVFAAASRVNTTTAKECTDSHEQQSCENKNQGEFVIWESLNRTVLSAVNF
jgi:maltose-binding protein MalE